MSESREAVIAVKINQVEAQAGIAKKNIRFYEEQGLISPRRNAENGYREYTEEDVQTLQRIRLMRKLGISIEEIRQMILGSHTVGDGIRRHMITLEREMRNLEQSQELCRRMQTMEIPLSSLDAGEILTRMEQLESAGTTFRNDQKKDVRTQYTVPVIVTGITVLLMAAIGGLILWAYRISPEDAPPVWFLLVPVGLLAAVAVGAVIALAQRIQEIRKGEMDDAKYY